MEENKNQEQPKGLQVSKEVPKEVKEQIAPDGKPRVITENIPKEHVEMLEEQKKNRQKFLNQFLQVSFQMAKAQEEQQKLLKKIDDFDNSFRGKIEWVMRKMKLNRMQNRAWRYDGRESFIGIYNPPKPKK